MGPVGLLEREDELATISEAIDASVQGAGRLVAIEGPAGIGKTRLLSATREAAAQAQMRVLAARGGTLERSFAYGVVRQLFEAALARGTAEEKDEALGGAAALAAPLFEALPEESTRPSGGGTPAILHGLFWLAVNLAERRPLLLAIDDLHWSDPSSLEWLGYLLRRLEGLPILLAVALRPAEPGSDPLMLAQLTTDPLATVLRPALLSAKATRVLVEQGLRPDADEEFCAACHQATGGNPLLLHELLDALAAEKVPPRATEVSRVQEIGPGAVSRSVRLRLATLPEEAQSFARAVAVLGDDADLDAAAALAEIDREAAAEAAGMLASIDIVRSERELSFVHPLVREAVYSELPPRERGRAHARAAEILAEQKAPPEQVAAHLLIAPPASSRSAVETLRAAARLALARFAAANAEAYLRRALEEPPPPEQRVELLFDLASVEALIRNPRAHAHLHEALSGTTDFRRKAEIELALARVHLMRNATRECIEVLDRAAARLPPGDDFRDLLEAELVGTALGDPSLHETGARRLVQLGEPSGETLGGKMLLAFAAYDDARRGDNRGRCIERAVRALAGGTLLADETSSFGISQSFYAAALGLRYAGQLEQAGEAFAQAQEAARLAGNPVRFAIASAALARVLLDRGLVFEAEADARTSLAACPAGQPIIMANVAGVATLVLMERDDLPGAASALSWGSPGESELTRSLHYVMYIEPRGQLRRLQRDPTEALRDFLRMGEMLEPIGCRNPSFAHWRSEAALTLLQLERRSEARHLASEALPLARAWGDPIEIGRALIALGLVEGRQRGLKLLRQAVGVLEPSEGGYQLLRARVELGAALRRANQRAEARDLLRRSLEQAQRCGAALQAKRAHAELLASGARPRRLVLSGVESLTGSERRIAAMAASGMTNREIAQSLFVTPKTIEMHLGHVFAKLDISSRTALPAALTAG